MSYQHPPHGPPPGNYPGQPGPGGPMPPPEQQAPQDTRQRRPGSRLLLSGLIMLGVSIIGGIVAIALFTVSMLNSFEDFADSANEITEPVTVDSLGDNHWYLYQDPAAATEASCNVTDEQGNDVTVGDVDMEFTNNDYDLVSVQSFESSADGVYEIDCTDYPVVLAGSVPLGGIVGLIISIALAGLLFVAGAVLTIVGIVTRSRSKNTQQPPMGPQYAGGPPPGYGSQPPQQPYGQQPPQYGDGPRGGYPPADPPQQSPN